MCPNFEIKTCVQGVIERLAPQRLGHLSLLKESYKEHSSTQHRRGVVVSFATHCGGKLPFTISVAPAADNMTAIKRQCLGHQVAPPSDICRDDILGARRLRKEPLDGSPPLATRHPST